MRALRAISVGLAAGWLAAVPAPAADLELYRDRVVEANAGLSRQVEEVRAKLSDMASPLSLPDAEVLAFNAWIDEKVAEERRLYEELRLALDGMARSLSQEGLPPTAMSRFQEMYAEYQARYSALFALVEAFEHDDHRMRPRGEGIQTQADAGREDQVRQNVALLSSGVLAEVEQTRRPTPKRFHLPPWKDVRMKDRLPKRAGDTIVPAYHESFAAPSQQTGLSADTAGGQQAALSAPAAATLQSADTVQTVDTAPNQKLRDLAASLDHDPIKMYEWVLNNIVYQPYYGSAKGAVKTFYDRAGNDFDTASLLISLYRESGIPARYVYGLVTLTAEQANNLFGTDSAVTAAAILAKGGIPVRWDGFGLIVEHCWVEAYVPYDSYRGTRSLPGGDTWVPLDPSLKVYDYQAGLLVAKDVQMDWKSFFENGVTQKTAVEIWKDKIAEHLATVQPGASIEDVPRKRSIRAEHLGALPLSLKVPVNEVHWEAAEIADELRHKVQFKYFEASTADWSAPTELDVTLPLPRILSGRITLNWIPATPEDAAIIERFGGLYRTPSYLIKLKAAVMLEGEVMDAGLPVTLGSAGYLRQYAILPAGVQGATDDFGNVYQVIKKQIDCPSIYGLGFGFQGYAEEYVQERIARLEASRESHSYDDVYGEIAYLNAITWYQRVYDSDTEAASLRHFTNYPSQVAMGFSQLGAGVEGMLGGVLAVSAAAETLSLDMLMVWTMTPLHLEQVEEDVSKLMGASDSQLEHMVLEEYYTVQAVSAVKLIQQAYADGVPVRNGWVDPSQGAHIFMDGDVEIFNYRGRGRIEGGYFISGDLSGGSFAAYIGVSIKRGAHFVFAQGGPLAFRVALNSVAPMKVIGNYSFSSMLVFRGATQLQNTFSYNVVYLRNEWQRQGTKWVLVGLYNLDVTPRDAAGNPDWSVLTPGNYTLQLTLKPYYWIEDSHVGTVPFTVYAAIGQNDPIRLQDGQGNAIPINYSSGRIYLPFGEQVCISGVPEFWIRKLDGSTLLHSLGSACYRPTAPDYYKVVYIYRVGDQLYNGVVEVVVLKVDLDYFTNLMTWPQVGGRSGAAIDNVYLGLHTTPTVSAADLRTGGFSLRVHSSETLPGGYLDLGVSSADYVYDMAGGDVAVVYKASTLERLGVLPTPEADAMLEFTSCDNATGSAGSNHTDSDAFDSQMQAKGFVRRGKARDYGDYSTLTSRANQDFMIHGGVQFFWASAGAAQTEKRQIRDQADWLYWSGHGHHNDGKLETLDSQVGAADVSWHNDLDVAVLAGCSVLDIKNYRAQSFGIITYGEWLLAGGDWSPGAQWETTGPQYLLGYCWRAPLDTEGTAGIVNSFFTAYNGGASIPSAWGTANNMGMGRNACVIDTSVTPHEFWYWDETSGSPVWTKKVKGGSGW